MSKGISYSRVALTPASGQVFSYALNNGIVTSLVAFLGDIFRSKQSLIEKSKNAQADISAFSELERIILFSAAEDKRKNEGMVLSPKAERILEKRFSGYVVTEQRFKKALWADIPTDKVANLLENM